MRLIVCALVIGAFLQAQAPPPPAADDPIRTLVGRLDLEKYKATIKGLTQFGDRRQGTARNRQALDWIEAQRKSDGCAPERITYTYTPRPPAARGAQGAPGTPGTQGAGRGRGAGNPAQGQGGSRIRGVRRPTGVNNDPMKQPDEKIRQLDSEPAPEGPGERQDVFCTKIGSVHPDEMYIIGAHMDGIGWGEAANDDGSGTALVMELARVFSSPDVKT